jgi:predicted NBD/HSP70 family sugar kinase
MHSKWTALLQSMATGAPGAGVSPEMLGEVLVRAALAADPVPRSEISKGTMLPHPTPLAPATVGKAADALTSQGLLTPLEIRRGQIGPPIRPLALGGPRWATVGIHVDQQHDGPDRLTGVLCGLDRQVLAGPEPLDVPKEEQDKHDLRGLAQGIRKLTETLLAHAAGLADRAAEQELLGVGVALGGHVYRGKVIDSTHAQWSQAVDLGEALTEELSKAPELKGVPVVVENDVNALAIQGYYTRSFSGPDAVLVAVFQQGVGGAMILDGRMYRGSNGLAPEPGHLAVDYPKIADSGGARPPARDAGKGLTFDDECRCSSRDHKMYGHVDTLATPSRIEGQLAAQQPGEEITLAGIADAPRAVPGGAQGHLVVSEEAKILHRAGRGLGRGLAHIINIVNPGQLTLLLPEPLANPGPGRSGTEYLEAAEREIDNAYSTGPSDARGGAGHIRLTVQSYLDDNIAYQGAVAAATTAFNAFTEHACGLDGCEPAQKLKTKTQPDGAADRRPAASRRGGVRERRSPAGTPAGT